MNQKTPRILVYMTQFMATGGIESHILQFCKSMANAGIEIDLIALNFNGQPSEESHLREICHTFLFGRGSKLSTKIHIYLNSIRLARSRKHHAIYTNGQGNSLLLPIFLKRKNTHWVHHHHTSGDTQDKASWSLIYRKALNLADTVIACSSRNAANMSEILQREIQTIPCFSRQTPTPRKNVTKDQTLHFGYFGRLIPEKGIDLLAQLAQDPDTAGIHFHIWGEGTAYPKTFFEGKPRLSFHGTFEGRQGLTQAMAKLDAFLLLSTHPEGLPICLLETMSAGLPWIATDRGGISDIACDPLSTRLISPNPHYDEVKTEVINLAEDLKNGRISPQKQRQLYAENFAEPVLVKRWKHELTLK